VTFCTEILLRSDSPPDGGTAIVIPWTPPMGSGPVRFA
jgi:hypothetical protein